MTDTLIDLDAELGVARLPEQTVPICLRGDLIEQLEAAREALARHQDGGLPEGVVDNRLAPHTATTADPELVNLQAAVDEAEAAVREHVLPFRVRGLTRPDYRALREAHPPRDDAREDRATGVNEATFPDALLRACLVNPPIRDDAQFTRLVGVLSEAQHDELVLACLQLTRRKTDLPFSSGVSAKTPTSADS